MNVGDLFAACVACTGQAATQAHHKSKAWGCGSMQVTKGMIVSVQSMRDVLVTSPAVCIQKAAAWFA